MSFPRSAGPPAEDEYSPVNAHAQEQALLAAARPGEEGAYRHFVEAHRAELHAHCYRMLGSVQHGVDGARTY